jgi:hypothetical protein
VSNKITKLAEGVARHVDALATLQQPHDGISYCEHDDCDDPADAIIWTHGFRVHVCDQHNPGDGEPA